MIDNESSIDILFYDAFSKISISDDRMGPISFSLVGFTSNVVSIEGIITLSIMASRYPKQSKAQVNFLVVRTPSAYNAILD